MLQLILITNSPEIALKAQASGVDIVMVDLEIIGKQDRQGFDFFKLSMTKLLDLNNGPNV